MLKGKTKSGFEFEIDEKVADDMELLEALVEAEEQHWKFPKLIERILGTEQKQRFYDHLRTKKGNVPVAKAMKEFVEVLNEAGAKTKNS